MFIGEIQEVGTIEVLVTPQVVPDEEPAFEVDPPILEPAESG